MVALTGIERVSGQFRSAPQSLTHSFFMPARMGLTRKGRFGITACDVGVMFGYGWLSDCGTAFLAGRQNRHSALAVCDLVPLWPPPAMKTFRCAFCVGLLSLM